VNCLEFERLLDEGEPERLPAEALEHAHDCASCARSLARARSLERALAAHFSPARVDETPAGFTQRVMVRVERGEARGVRWLALPDVMPLWTRAAAEPGVALASAVAALILWRGDRVIADARALWPMLASTPARFHELMLAAGFGPAEQAIARVLAPESNSAWAVSLGVCVGLAPLLVLLGWMMWRAGERLVETAAATAPR